MFEIMTIVETVVLPVLGAVLLFILIGGGFALLLRLLTRLVAGFSPRYPITFTAWLLGWLAPCIVGVLFGSMRSEGFVIAGLAILLKPLIYCGLLKSPEGLRFSLGKSLIIVLIELVVVAVLVAVVVLYCLLTLHAQM